MVKLLKSNLKMVRFRDSKILGVDFSVCKDFMFQVEFQNCLLDYSSLVGKKMARVPLKDSSLKGVNFSDTDLSCVDFGNSNLEEAIFKNTALKNADFSNALGFLIDPELKNFKKAKFSLHGLPGLLPNIWNCD